MEVIKLEREKTFVKSTLIIAIGKICTQLVTFFLLPLYTGILSTEEYGIIDLLNAVIHLLIPIVTLQIEQALFRELLESRNNIDRHKEIISSSVFYVILQCIIYLIIFAIISPFINNDYKIFLAVNLVVCAFSSLFLQIARGLGDNKKYAFGSFLCAVSIVCLNILFLVVFKLRVTGMLLGTLLGNIICLIYLIITLKIPKYLSFSSFSKKRTKQLLTYSLPLVPNSISWWVFSASDRVIVSSILTLSATGILSVANKFPTIITTIYNIFHLSFLENILLYSKDNDIKEYYNKMFNIIVGLFLSLSIGILACMPFAFPIMVNAKFSEAYNLIPIITLANIFNIIVSLIGVIYSANRNTKSIATTSVISAIINIIVHLGLIKFVGIYAAVVSTFVAYFVMAMYRIYTAKKLYFKVEINKSMIIKTILILPIVLISYYINNLYLNIIILLMAIIYAWSINKNSLGIIINMIKKKKIILKRKEE